MVRRLIALGAVAAALGCGSGEPSPPVDSTAGTPSEDAGTPAVPLYERNFVFASQANDTLLLVPWLLSTTGGDEPANREAAGWLARGGIWDPFYDESWTTPQLRSPTRLLPTADLSFVVGESDQIEGVVFAQPSRSLDLVIGDATANWVGPLGENFSLYQSAAYLSDQRIDGIVLDMSRASGGDVPPGGDWALLLSGDSSHFVFAAEYEHGGEIEPDYRAWADLPGGQELQWSDIRVDWRETQAFPPARRDVPVAWRIWTEDGFLEGELEALSAEIQPGEGPGPLLPVRALFEVTGDISTVNGNFPVTGLVVHERR